MQVSSYWEPTWLALGWLCYGLETVCFGGSEREKGQINSREYNAQRERLHTGA